LKMEKSGNIDGMIMVSSWHWFLIMQGSLDWINLGLDKQQKLNFEISMALTMMITVFWVAMPCSFVERNQWLGGTCCLHLAGQETAIFNKANNGYYENWYTRENKTIIWQFCSIKYFIWISSEFYISHNSALYNFTDVKHLFVWMIKERDICTGLLTKNTWNIFLQVNYK
jgi:hypothetical protein